MPAVTVYAQAASCLGRAAPQRRQTAAWSALLLQQQQRGSCACSMLVPAGKRLACMASGGFGTLHVAHVTRFPLPGMLIRTLYSGACCKERGTSEKQSHCGRHCAESTQDTHNAKRKLQPHTHKARIYRGQLTALHSRWPQVHHLACCRCRSTTQLTGERGRLSPCAKGRERPEQTQEQRATARAAATAAR